MFSVFAGLLSQESVKLTERTVVLNHGTLSAFLVPALKSYRIQDRISVYMIAC